MFFYLGFVSGIYRFNDLALQVCGFCDLGFLNVGFCEMCFFNLGSVSGN